MAQPPFQIDALQILGDSTGTRLIEDDADGSLKFTDENITAGINLQQLPGLQQVDKVYLVGTGGFGVGKDAAGTAYNTIQAAIDDVPSSLTKNNPALILVAPGEYIENLVIEKDGIEIRGLGQVIIKNSGDADTVTLQDGASTSPLSFRLRDVRVENDRDNRACVLLSGGIGSTLGNDYVEIVDVDMVATGVGTFHLDADIMNVVRVLRGNWAAGSASSSLTRIQQVASCDIKDVEGVILQMSYDITGSIPATAGSSYTIKGLRYSGAALVDLDGAGSFVSEWSRLGNTTLNGDRTARFVASETGTLTLNDTVAVTFIGGTHGTLAGAAGSSLEERVIEGSVSFAASASEAVAFAAPHPDVQYTVTLDSELTPAAFNDIPQADNKTTSGFDIVFGAAQTTTVRFVVTRTV